MALKSFVEVKSDSHFSIHNLPYGIFKHAGGSITTSRPGVAIGDYVLDLSEIHSAGLFDGPLLSNSDCFHQSNLNKFLELGKPAWKEARATLQKLLSSAEPSLQKNASLREKALLPMVQVEMLLPVAIGDYTDFFSSMHHAKNCGTIFRGPENPINPNWYHLPIAYHGRASSIVISGTDIVRPRGQGYPTGNSPPYFGPSRKLDFELEMAAVVGPGNDLGKPIDVNEAADHIFGVVLLNDWSARDIQAWEYVPLGPFLGKSFGTTISPWIVTLDALEPFACDAPNQIPKPLPYLAENISKNYDISLEVRVKPAGEEDSFTVTRSNFNHLYWTLTQQLTHHTINGCNLRPGDLLGTGTISGPEPESYGCLLELTWNGTKELPLGKTTRRFLEDGDEVIFSGCCKGNGYNVGFGTCSGKIVPSSP
ncbi:fumarylacetoacetase [Cynara cardunculus var. scolymus]|uniref:fumarylacetoacetase n=1 Tax=Cynara cardunculus var. scolymus TaxID=59895 RepID=UPI000D62EAED|nr:fumarylacetoacetase [Cynara cardunculus var. scolymus]